MTSDAKAGGFNRHCWQVETTTGAVEIAHDLCITEVNFAVDNSSAT
jgi:hypothetical protein